MISQKSFGQLKKVRFLIIRRVKGDSMKPTLKSDDIVVGSRLIAPKLNKLVIVSYNGRDIIKRVKSIKKDSLYIVGDNEARSTDSRHFGWVSKESLTATVIWPKK
jgi:phage repressor protein C with HTH and peptisase S24 domain